MSKLFLITAAASALIACVFPAMAADEHRELGSHEHGHGRLNIAVEGSRVSMELEAPAADLVGFEHEPSTWEQKAAVEKAKATLAEALSMFKLPAAAGCKLANAEVAIRAEEEHQPAAAEHKGKAGQTEAETRHSEFHVTYAIDCAAPEKLTEINFGYFDAFAGARELDVNIVTPNGQTHYEVTREQPKLKLGEIG